MDVKAKIEEFLEIEDLIYIDVFMDNGISFNLFKPNQEATLNVETTDEYLKIYGSVDENSRIESAVPYEKISHVNGTFGKQESIEYTEEGVEDIGDTEDIEDTENIGDTEDTEDKGDE